LLHMTALSWGKCCGELSASGAFGVGAGEVRYVLGERLADRYLEFVAGRCRPSTLRAVAFDLKAFF
jgi:hypothetical protein